MLESNLNLKKPETQELGYSYQSIASFVWCVQAGWMTKWGLVAMVGAMAVMAMAEARVAVFVVVTDGNAAK